MGNLAVEFSWEFWELPHLLPCFVVVDAAINVDINNCILLIVSKQMYRQTLYNNNSVRVIYSV